MSREFEKRVHKMLSAELGLLKAKLVRVPARQREETQNLKRLISEKQKEVSHWLDKTRGLA